MQLPKNLFAFLTSLFWLGLQLANPLNTNAQSMIITGHRGAAGHAPENTMISIRKALEMGADRVEIDVQQTSDAQIVALHDRSLDRTTPKKGKVSNYSWEELKNIAADNDFPEEFPEARIPLLTEILDTIARYDAKLLIEVKEGSSVYPGIEKRIVELVRSKNMTRQVILQSFRDEVVDRFISMNLEIPVHKLFVFKIRGLPLIYDGKLRFRSLRSYGPVAAFNVYYKFARKGLIRRIHKLDKEVSVWTVNEREIFEKLRSRGVDGVITDYPNRMMQEN